ncbi:MAG: 50S ribosomal protein L17 [Candidatus Wildermuthbacteria bacterium]|nr:50S ribosomal protein L17 [Candidatus Wildermuthbacteria bacterium]
MKKQFKSVQLRMKSGPRKGLLRGLVRSLVLHKKIQTTHAKAQVISPMIEKMITRAKKGDLASRRLLISAVGQETAKALVEKIAPQYKEKRGGYTRILKLGPRKSDNASMAIIELV